MRVRVLDDPKVIKILNERACCVDYNLVEDGFPFHLPVFQALGDAVMSMPWYRLNFAMQVVIDAKGTRMFTSQFSDFVDSLVSGNPDMFTNDRIGAAIERHDQWLKAVNNEGGDLKEIEEALDTRRIREKAIVSEPRFWTASFLGSRLNKWSFVSSLFDRAAPGVLNSVVHALGEMLVDDSPVEPGAASILRSDYPDDFTDPSKSSVGSADVPHSMKVRAAEELEKLTSVPMGKDPEVAAKWYLENKDEPKWRVEWSDDPRLKYAFTLPQPGA